MKFLWRNNCVNLKFAFWKLLCGVAKSERNVSAASAFNLISKKS